MVCGVMEVEVPKSKWDKLYDTQPEKVESAVATLKNCVIGSFKQKEQIVQEGLLARLVNLVVDPDIPARVKTNVVHIIGSVSKGPDVISSSLLDTGVIRVLLDGLINSDTKLTEACLFTLVNLFQSKDANVEVFYSDPAIVSHLLSLMPRSTATGTAVCRLLSLVSQSTEHQNILVSSGFPQAICSVLSSRVGELQLAALRALATILHKNESAAQVYLATTSSNGKSLVGQVISYSGREYDEGIQLEAAKIFTYMYRCGVLDDEEGIIVYRVLPTLVRLCRKEEDIEHRIEAAETLAYLTQVNVKLQQIAAISNHLIPTVAGFLRWEPEPVPRSNTGGMTRVQVAQMTVRLETEARQARSLRKAAFHVFSSLAANDEDIRKRLIDTDPFVESVVGALNDADEDVQLAAIRCLHSLSRSVQLLQTTFQDYTVWEPVMKILSNPSSRVESVLAASSTLCNLLLVFSPSKERILESGAVELLCELTLKHDPCLRVNGVWGLMNLSYNAEQRIKAQIMTTLGTDQMFRLLSDTEMKVTMKTLGLLRNLLSDNKQHIDHITGLCGKQLMPAFVFILESENSHEVKEQALCLLATIADGDASKKLIVDNEDILKKLKSYMLHNNSALQTAAVLCILNLVWREEEGSADRQAKLMKMGVFTILRQLLTTTEQDAVLFGKVKQALQQTLM